MSCCETTSETTRPGPMQRGSGGPRGVSFLLTSEPPLMSLRMPVTNLVVEASHETGIVTMSGVVHPCGPAVGKRLSRFRNSIPI